MEISPAIETTEDGSATLRHPVIGDTYHSLRGAHGEAMHVFINNGLKLTTEKQRVNILEAGFGSGLNAWLTLEYARKNGIQVDYHAVELYPVGLATVRELGYTIDKLFLSMHEAEWGKRQEILPCFAITKYETDLSEIDFDNGKFDLVYFDAFAPDTQPELWTAEFFGKIYAMVNKGGALVTYSAKGDVKRALREAGFEVKRLEGALGKRHMLRAVKI